MFWCDPQGPRAALPRPVPVRAGPGRLTGRLMARPASSGARLQLHPRQRPAAHAIRRHDGNMVESGFLKNPL